MNVRQCDRCGSFLRVKALVSFVNKDDVKIYDLCDGCAMRFEKFMQGDVKE